MPNHLIDSKNFPLSQNDLPPVSDSVPLDSSRSEIVENGDGSPALQGGCAGTKADVPACCGQKKRNTIFPEKNHRHIILSEKEIMDHGQKDFLPHIIARMPDLTGFEQKSTSQVLPFSQNQSQKKNIAQKTLYRLRTLSLKTWGSVFAIGFVGLTIGVCLFSSSSFKSNGAQQISQDQDASEIVFLGNKNHRSIPDPKNDRLVFDKTGENRSLPTEIVPSPQGESYTIVQKYDETASRNDTTFEPVFSNNPAYQPSNQPVVSHNQENHVPWERVPGSPVATTTMPVGKVTSFPMQGQPGMNGNSNGNMPIHSRPMETAVYQPSPGYYPPNGVQQTMPGGVLPDTSSGMSSPNSWGQPQQTRIAPNQVNGFGAEQPYFGQGQPLQAQAQSYPSYPAYEASTNSLRAGANDYTPVSQQVSYSGTAPASYQQPGQSPYGIACSQVQIPVPPQGNLAQYPSAQQPPYTPNGMTPPQNYSLDTGRSFRDQVDPLNSQINSQYPSQPTEIARGYQQQNFAPNSGSAGLANPSSNNYR